MVHGKSARAEGSNARRGAPGQSAEKSPDTKIVVWWTESDQVSTEDISKAEEEHRYVGAVTKVQSGAKRYTGKIMCISADKDELKEAEDNVLALIDHKVEEEKQKTLARESRAARGKRIQVKGSASENDVTAAIGGRKKAEPHQTAKAKELAALKRASEAARRQSELEVDQAASKSVARNLFNDESVLNADDDDEESSADVEVSDDDGHEESENVAMNVSEQISNSSGPEEARRTDSSGTTEHGTCCAHCRKLQSALILSPDIVKSLDAIYRLGTKEEDVIEYLETLPIPSNISKCEISKGMGAFMKVTDKNDIKKDGDSDPSKMTRMGIICLYGEDRLKTCDVTSKGLKKGSKGLRPEVLKALRSFVNRNRGEQFKELTEAGFNHVINSKLEQLRRVALNKKKPSKVKDTPIKKKRSAGKSKSPLKSPQKSPLKTPRRHFLRSPSKQSPAKAKSPAKQSLAKSPGKMAMNNWEVQEMWNTPGPSGPSPHSAAPQFSGNWLNNSYFDGNSAYDQSMSSCYNQAGYNVLNHQVY